MSSGRRFALVVIDMSQEQLYPDGKAILPNWKGYENILSLASKLPQERVIDSRLWIEEADASTLRKLFDGNALVKLLKVGNAGSDGAKLVSHLKDMKATFTKKIQYSAFFGSQLNSLLKAQDVNTVLFTGINTDYCVFASALDAFYLGYEVWLIRDACGSFGGPKAHEEGLAQFKKFLVSRGTILSTTEALAFLQP